MAVLNPLQTTLYDLLTQALKDAGVLGIGQTPLAEDINDAWARLQWTLQQAQQERFMIYHLVTYLVAATGQTTPYSVGIGGQIDISLAGQNNPAPQEPTYATRPDQIESAFFQQSTNVGRSSTPIVFPLRLMRSMEDYRQIALPSLSTFPLLAFYDPAWPLGQLYIYPWPNLPSYSIGITVREQLPQAFPSLKTPVTLPFVYYKFLVSSTAMAVRPKYGIGTFPGDLLPAQAKRDRDVVRKGSTVVRNLSMPGELVRNGNYNIYSDQST